MALINDLDKLSNELAKFKILKANGEFPEFYTRSYFNNNGDQYKYPEITKTAKYEQLYNQQFLKRTPFEDSVTMVGVDQSVFNSVIDLNWPDINFEQYNEETFEKYKETTDLEFKHCYLFNKIKNHFYPSNAVSSELYDNLMQNYLNNLVFTRWLYQHFIDFKQNVRAQKKNKRDNYKRNLRERLNES